MATLEPEDGALPFLQFEILKSLAVELRIPILLVGAYDLLGILDGTGQLLRRSQIIHLPRYRAGAEGVDPNFIDALHTLLEAIKIPMDENLAHRADYFFLKSVGCIGTLKDWLDRTGQRAAYGEIERLKSEEMQRLRAGSAWPMQPSSDGSLSEKRSSSPDVGQDPLES
ncbi:hypothetical protein [Rhodoferax sp. OV413]|uniref:hypothetical protein n=1 Tax=Rhodoferax sp. OV413 TaxID=1855285 RepID=UPI00115FD34A|nr:hypothetical protein [Rhodoferax sp. OV413]